MNRNETLRRGNIGDNRPDSLYAQEVSDRLGLDYAELINNADDLIAQAEALPGDVADEADLETFSDIVVKLRDATKRSEAMRVAEKEPHLRASQAVDRFFDSIKDKIAAATKPLTAAVNAFNTLKAARERLRLQREREQKAKAEQAAREEAAARLRLANEAARKAEEAKRYKELAIERSIDATAMADTARAEHLVAQDDLQAARVAAARPTRDLVRQRFENTGRLVTSRQRPYAEIINADALDATALWPYVPLAAKEQALRAFAKATSYKMQTPGAAIGIKDEAVIK
jgi:hypothetical protein